MENNLIDPQNTVNQLHAFAANMLVNQDKNSYEVKKALIEKGVDEESAAIIVENVEIQIEEARKSRANKDLLYGALWLFGGIVVTAFTYSAASGGGRYVVAWGAILFGAIQFVRGLINSTK